MTLSFLCDAGPPKGFVRNLKVMFDVTDVVDDVQSVVDDTVRA